MDKIAIVGLSCLFPEAKTPEQYWHNLLSERDSTSMATDAQMGVDADFFLATEKGTQDKYYCARGGYIRDFTFAPDGYKVPPEQLVDLDDLFKWALYVSRQALADSGYLNDATALERCGVVLGNLSFPTKSSHHLFAPIYAAAITSACRELLQEHTFALEKLPAPLHVSKKNLMIAGYPAAVICQALGLGGTNFVLDAACASSLYAVKMASHYLLSGKADMMLAGAVSRADPFFINMGFSIFQAYPENGRSQPLNATSAGLIAGEGAGMFILKRHADALRDGDKIYAVIRGIGLSNDGHGKFLLQPNSKGQVLAFERAYADAKISPAEIDYLECHATGTPVGDRTEINSMDDFFGRHGSAPLVGSSKSNFGHMLTAAGMAGMIKVILGIANKQIPATINLTDPLASHQGRISGAQMVKSLRPWPQNSHMAKAAVNAFGFGGTNAHLIIEEASAELPSLEKGSWRSTGVPAKKESCSIAIVGMDAFFGSLDGLKRLGQAIYDGEQDFREIPTGRWCGIEDEAAVLAAYGFENGKAPKGAYIDEFDLDFLHFKIPPNRDTPIPQQLLILKVADRAIKDAGLAEGGNVAVIIAAGAELALHRFRGRCDLAWQLTQSLEKAGIELSQEQQIELEDICKDSIHEPAQVNQYTSFIGNIMASRISSQWDFSGPSFTLSAEENSAFKALELAELFLATSEADAVVVGAVDLAGSMENVLLRNTMHQITTGRLGLSYGQEVTGWAVGEGAGAVVLKRSKDAIEAGDRVYATIEAIGLTHRNEMPDDNSPDSREIKVVEACRQAFSKLDIKPEDVAYLELFASGISHQDDAEMMGLAEIYRTQDAHLTCAIGSIKANIGHTFAASGIASLIKTAHCLHHRYIPATPDWSGAKSPDAWSNTSFYVRQHSTPWLLPHEKQKRIAAINGLGADNSYAHLILSELPDQPEKNRRSEYLAAGPPHLFPFSANNPTELIGQINDFQTALKEADSLPVLASEYFQKHAVNSTARYSASILGATKTELEREITAALRGIPESFSSGAEWKTPNGSYFSARPLGKCGKLAFIYPGAFAAYPGLGRDLFQLFPQLHDSFAALVPNPAELVGERWLYPRSLNPLAKQQLQVHTDRFMQDSIAMMQAGATYSNLATKILREQFKVQPQAALGYSLGETSMMFALDIWSVQDNNSADLRNSPLFRNRLSGSQDALREFWGISSSASNGKPIWAIHVLRTSPARAEQAMENFDKVYLTHINTPGEIVIGGHPKQCLELISQLQCEHVAVPYNHIIHCEVMCSEFAEFKRLNTLPLLQKPNFDLYFAANQEHHDLDSETIGHDIASAACQRVDFPGLVQRAYDGGCRIFVELGPRSACTWWIAEILQGKPHLAVGINRRSLDDRTAMLMMLAQLSSHRIQLDLAPFYEAEPPQMARAALVKPVVLTGKSIRGTILAPKNRERFSQIVRDRNFSAQKEISAIPLSTTAEMSSASTSLPAQKTGISQDKRTETMNNEPIKVQRSARARIQRTDGGSPYRPDVAASSLVTRQLQKLQGINSQACGIHAQFLQSRAEAITRMFDLIEVEGNGAAVEPAQTLQRQNTVNNAGLNGAPASEHPQRQAPLPPRQRLDSYSKPEQIIWDQDALLQFAEGDIAPVFGEEYASIDGYARRVRLPMPPYLLVSRVTKLRAQRGVYEPSGMTTEYDIPFDSWYATDGQIPWAVAVESGQCDLLLISYLGIDFKNQGQRVYRLLDCTLTFLEEMAMEGQTLRYDISIDSFAKSGDSLLFFFSYDCFVGDKKVLKMRGGCAGFFSDEELAGGKGIIVTEKEKREKASIQKCHFTPLLQCARSSFERTDMIKLGNGEIAAVFGPQYEQTGLNPSLRLPPEGILMVDRIVSVDPAGGTWGLGLIISEKELNPNDWYFPCHFKDDQVLAGSLVAEGCSQLLQFFLLYLGLQKETKDARFQPILDLPQVVRTRKQIMACSSKLIYRMEITEIGLSPHPFAKADVDIIFEGCVVVDFKNLGLQLVEKNGTNTGPRAGSKTVKSSKPALFNETHIQEFALGSISACFGPDYKVFEGRRIPRTPNGDLKLMSRIVKIEAERLVFEGSPGLVSEYDVPASPWFCTQNSSHTMPYAILMEIALQPCGFLSAYLGSTLPHASEDFYFRNLDGDGRLIKEIDARGKTIANRVSLLSSTAIQGIIIQKFSFALDCDAEVFYTGTAVFGYFKPEALANQIGLDQARAVHPWIEQEADQSCVVRINLNGPESARPFDTNMAAKPHYRFATGQLNFLDEVVVVPQGGQHGLGYVYAEKKVNPRDWFYECHFYQDPVMPGSLGVEAILQAMQAYVLQQNLGAHLQSPHFAQLTEHQIVWTYRGQIIPGSRRMCLEIHIRDLQVEETEVRLVGDASLWKDGLRIYEVQNVGLCLCET